MNKIIMFLSQIYSAYLFCFVGMLASMGGAISLMGEEVEGPYWQTPIRIQREAEVRRSGKLLTLEMDVPVRIRVGAAWIPKAREEEAKVLVSQMEKYVAEARDLADRADALALQWEALMREIQPLQER